MKQSERSVSTSASENISYCKMSLVRWLTSSTRSTWFPSPPRDCGPCCHPPSATSCCGFEPESLGFFGQPLQVPASSSLSFLHTELAWVLTCLNMESFEPLTPGFLKWLSTPSSSWPLASAARVSEFIPCWWILTTSSLEERIYVLLTTVVSALSR